MLLKNKLLISAGIFGAASVAGGGVYFFQKDKKSIVSAEEQILKKIPKNKILSSSKKVEPVVPKVQVLPSSSESSSISDEAKEKTLDPCEQHAIDHPRLPETENNKKAKDI